MEETDPGVTPTDPNFQLLSAETQRVQPTLDKNLDRSQDIGNFEPEEFVSAMNTYGFEVEGHLYRPVDIFQLIERLASGEVRFFTLEFIPNADATDPVFIRARGMRPVSVELSAGIGEPWTWTVEFGAGVTDAPTTVDPGIGTGSRETKDAITEPQRTFASGAIQLDAATWALLVGSFNLSVDHETEAAHTTGDPDPVPEAALVGQRVLSGSADVSFDNGYQDTFDRTQAFDEHTIFIPFGSEAGDPAWELQGVVFPDWSPELTTDTKVVQGGRDYEARSIVSTTV